MDTVLFLCPSLAGAGVERKVSILVNRLDQSKYRLLLGILRREGQFLGEVADHKIVYVEKPFWLQMLLLPVGYLEHIHNFFLALYQIDRLIKKTKPSVVVTFTLEATVPTYLVTFLWKLNQLVWIISEDSNTPEAVKSVVKGRTISKLILNVFSRIYQKADHVTAVSNAVRKSVIENYKLPKQNVQVIYNPVDQQIVLSQAGNEMDGPFDGNYLLSVGRLVKVKRYDLLLRAFALVRKHKPLKLVILGEGPEHAKLKQISEGLGIAAEVVFAGFTANPWWYMKHAQALLLTSRQEGFSNVIAESMMVGCPVISTRSGGPEDIIIQNQSGILVNQDCWEIAEETIKLLEDQQKRLRIVKQAQKQALRFLPESICAQVTDLLDRLLEERWS